MIGRQLNAQSCTMLLLVVVGVLLSLNLYAQYGTRQGEDPALFNTRDSQREVAVAAQNLASATDRVAQANQQIAQSLDKVAKAISGLKLEVNLGEAGSVAPPSGDTSSAAAPAGPTSTPGSFKLN